MAKVLAAETRTITDAQTHCRLCDGDVCGHPARCPGHPGGAQHRLRNPSYRGRRMAAPDENQTLPGTESRAAIVGAGPPASTPPTSCSRPASRSTSTTSLPTPFGLVRAGVAPDHPKIKSVTRVYEKTAAQPGFRFFGGVELGVRRRARGPARALPRGRLRGRHARRQPARHPRRGPPRLARGDRVRRLVQRPPRLRRPRVRPLGARARS